jgi:hypothetical protein
LALLGKRKRLYHFLGAPHDYSAQKTGPGIEDRREEFYQSQADDIVGIMTIKALDRSF